MKLENIVDGLNSTDGWERQDAQKALQAWGPGIVRPLFDLWSREKDQKYKSGTTNPWFKLPLFLGLLYWLWCCVVIDTEGIFKLLMAFAGFLIFIYLLTRKLGVNVAVTQRAELANQRMRTLSNIVEGMEDPAFIGPLIGFMKVGHEFSGAPVIPLTRMLPMLSAGAVGDVITYEQWRILQDQISERMAIASPDFAIEIMRAAARMGDVSLIKRVGYLTCAPVPAEVARESELCLSALEAVAERNHHSRTLLRSTDHPAPSSNQLLRPAANGAADDPTILLRPTSKE
jgi:hypothetical protein